MNRLSPVLRNSLLAAVAVGSMSLSACVAETPVRPGVDYGYVAGTGSYSAPSPVYSDPYVVPYYDNTYYGYSGAYYGSGYYYGPSTTFIYTRDRPYPVYGYRPHGNDKHHNDRGHRDDRDDNHHRGPSRDRNRGDRWHSGRPGGNRHAGTPPPRHDPPRRPGAGHGRPERSSNGPRHGNRPSPPPRTSNPAGRTQRGDRKRD